jgi:hypothetical protein
MKKWFIGFFVIVLLLFGTLYLYIPNVIKLRNTVNIKVTRTGLYRMLLNKDNVANWWPGKTSNGKFYIDSFNYSFNNSSLSVMPVTIKQKDFIIPTSLLIIELAKDDTQIEWIGAMVTSYNPIKRFAAYLKSKEISNGMNLVLQKMEIFYSNPQNIYGFDIKKELVADSILIQTAGISKGYPSNEFIYSLVDKLKTYSSLNAARVTGYPMLNVRLADSTTYEVKVALPIDKVLPNADNILQKRMLGKGNILVAEVKGGLTIGIKAFDAIQKYAEDYQRIAPAIPFYSLITDRLKETDSSKWITKVYFPVM